MIQEIDEESKDEVTDPSSESEEYEDSTENKTDEEDTVEEAEEEQNRIVLMDKVKFSKILHSWFRQRNMDIGDIINLCYKYYYRDFHKILLVHHYAFWKDNDKSDGPQPSSESLLWIVHSNGNVYKIKKPNRQNMGIYYHDNHFICT